MKLLVSLAFCLVAPIHSARSAQTAYSQPIGFYTVKVSGGSIGGTPARTYFGAQLLTNTKHAGNVASVAGNTFSIQNLSSPNTLSDSDRESYAHVLTGSGAGFIANVEEFRQSDILCTSDLTPWMSPFTQVLIRSHPHLADIFGVANQFGLGNGPDADHADNVVVWDSLTQQERVYYFHSIRNRWEEKDVIADASKAAVRFPNGLYVIRRSTMPVRILLSGELGVNPVLFPVRPGSNVLSLPINLAASLQDLISSDGEFSVIKGPNVTSADLLTLEEPATGGRRGPFYFRTSPGSNAWREVGVNGSDDAAQPLELLSTLILRRNGPPGFVLARGNLQPPAPGTFVPVPSNPDPGEVPLTGQITRPIRFGIGQGNNVYVEKSTDLVTWVDFAFVPPGTTQMTVQLPAGESRTFYRFKALSTNP